MLPEPFLCRRWVKMGMCREWENKRRTKKVRQQDFQNPFALRNLRRKISESVSNFITFVSGQLLQKFRPFDNYIIQIWPSFFGTVAAGNFFRTWTDEVGLFRPDISPEFNPSAGWSQNWLQTNHKVDTRLNVMDLKDDVLQNEGRYRVYQEFRNA